MGPSGRNPPKSCVIFPFELVVWIFAIDPNNPVDFSKIRVFRYPVKEINGTVWVYIPEKKLPHVQPKMEPPNLLLPPGEKFLHVERVVLPTNIDHAVIGLVDPAHVTFVHQSWYWRSAKGLKLKEKNFEPTPMGFKMVRHKPSTNSKGYSVLKGGTSTEITFEIPGNRTEHIQVGEKNQIISITILTPLTENTTELNHIFYSSLRLVKWLWWPLKKLGKQFIGQDLDVFNKLSAGQAATLRLPDRLPDLPAAPKDEATVASIAMDQRLDVRMAQGNLEFVAHELGLTRITSVVNALEVGVVRKSETGLAPQKGYHLSVALPIFDFGDARRSRAQATYMAAFYGAAQLAVDARSQVRETYGAYRTAYDVAKHYRDEIVPLRRTIAEENILRYNGMLIGVFELLADSREQIASVVQAIEAQRDFWVADAALQATLIGKPMASASMEMGGGPGLSERRQHLGPLNAN